MATWNDGCVCAALHAADGMNSLGLVPLVWHKLFWLNFWVTLR
jgi:hypothetical protein